MSKVFIVHPIPNDLEGTNIKTYGELRFINKKYVYADELDDDGFMSEEVYDNMCDAAREIDIRRDFVALAGDHLQVAAFIAILASTFPNSNIQVLRFDRQEKAYFRVLI